MSIPLPDPSGWHDASVAGPLFEPIILWTPELYKAQPWCYRFWPGLGAVLFMAGLHNSKSLQGLFNTCGCQYLGKISYSFYLVHSFILKVPFYFLGNILVDNLSSTIGISLNFVLAVCSVFWAGDVVNRLVDEKVVLFSKWFYNKTKKQYEDRY